MQQLFLLHLFSLTTCFSLQEPLQNAMRLQFDWQMALLLPTGEWRCVTGESGEPCAATAGMSEMLQWSVENLDRKHLVCERAACCIYVVSCTLLLERQGFVFT